MATPSLPSPRSPRSPDSTPYLSSPSRHRDSMETGAGSTIVDPDYNFFFQHLRPDGKSYVLEIPPGYSAPPLCLKYEDNSFADGSPGEATQSHPLSCRAGNPMGSESEPRRSNSTWRQSPRRGAPSPDPCPTATQCRPFPNGFSDKQFDEDYRFFLSRLRLVNGKMVLQGDNGVVIRYEEEGPEAVEIEEDQLCEVSSSESEEAIVLEFENNAVVRYEEEVESAEEKEEQDDEGRAGEQSVEPAVTRKEIEPFSTAAVETKLHCDSSQTPAPQAEAGSSLAEVPGSSTSSFKLRLMNELQKPFDQSEYEELMTLAALRKPKEKVVNLRSSSKSYPTKELGKSYLDYHEDLAKQIECADRHESLALLRGFFFWLKNVGHEGAFKPWNVPCPSHLSISYTDCRTAVPARRSD